MTSCVSATARMQAWGLRNWRGGLVLNVGLREGSDVSVGLAATSDLRRLSDFRVGVSSGFLQMRWASPTASFAMSSGCVCRVCSRVRSRLRSMDGFHEHKGSGWRQQAKEERDSLDSTTSERVVGQP